ncbi:MAG: hypothetical protein LWY06_20410 [Firmicutes bacterium]|nr:hypothetical protein [Bacillota bacterium]
MKSKYFSVFLTLFALIMAFALSAERVSAQSEVDKYVEGIFKPTSTPRPNSSTNQMPNQSTRDDLKKHLKVYVRNASISRSQDSDGNTTVRFNLRFENKTNRTLTFYPRNILVYDAEGAYTECRIIRSGDHPKNYNYTNSSTNTQNDDINPNSDFKVHQDFDQKWKDKGKKPQSNYSDSNTNKKSGSNYANPKPTPTTFKPGSKPVSNYANPDNQNNNQNNTQNNSHYDYSNPNPTHTNTTYDYSNHHPASPNSNYDYSDANHTNNNTYGNYMNSVSVLPGRTNEVLIICKVRENTRPSWVVVKYGSYVVSKKRIGD